MAFDDQTWFFGDRAAANQTLRAMGADRMSGADFEEFVADLMEVTGFDVDRVGGPGDLGADLVARSEAVSLTVQVKRYGPEGAVSRRAVSDAVAARDHYDVGSAAVVTNRGFTSDAREFARGRCFLVARSFLGSWAATHAEAISDGGTSTVLDGLSGSEFESLLADLLRDRGYRVEEMGGSGDFGVDLVARDHDASVAIQAKRHSQAVSRRAVSDAVSGADYRECDEAWVVTTASSFTSGARTLAESTGARLVDREEVLDWLRAADVEPPAEKTSSPSLETPEAVADRLRWADQMAGASIGDATVDVKSGQLMLLLSAVFLRRVKARMTIPYRGVPEQTWFGVKFPRHSLLSWEPVHPEGRSHRNVHVVPLRDRQGRVHMDLTARIASGEGVQRGLSMIQNAIQTVAGGRLQGAFWSEEPSEEQLENLAERA